MNAEFRQRVEYFFSLPDDELLLLTGFYGVHSYADRETGVAKCFIDRTSFYPNKIRVHISSDKIRRCVREINVYNMRVYNEVFVSTRVLNRTGLRCLVSQVETARSYGFKSIELIAMVDEFDRGRWNGYYVWGKYGFLMCVATQQLEFMTMMKDHDQDQILLYDLLRTSDGRDFWQWKGGQWDGRFDLQQYSVGHLVLDRMSKLYLA